MRMLGKGRPFVMEIQNQRAEMPGQDYFTAVEQKLREVGAQAWHVNAYLLIL